MRFSFFSFYLGLSLQVVTVSQWAHAETKTYEPCGHEPSDSDITAAKGAYDAGQVSFQEADYDRALLYWEDAFRRDCTAVKLLLNIARAYELRGDLPLAVNALETYLARSPQAKDRTSVEKRIANLKERAERDRDDKEANAATTPDTTNGGAERPEEPPPHLTPVDQSTAQVKPRPVWPLVLTGIGVATALTGHTVAALQQRRIEDRKDAIALDLGCNPATNECETDEQRDAANEAVDSDAEIADLRDKRDAANSLAGLGHIAGITGGVFWWILWTQHKSPSESAQSDTYLQPVVAPGYQGLSFSGRF